jgi:hypothetical protein
MGRWREGGRENSFYSAGAAHSLATASLLCFLVSSALALASLTRSCLTASNYSIENVLGWLRP